MSTENNIKIEFNPSAFKYGCTEDDIFKAIDTFCYDGDVVGDIEADNKFLLIGFDINANLIEVIYNVIDENSINVFHAMKCRDVYIKLIEK